jgi:hypothetical protein
MEKLLKGSAPSPTKYTIGYLFCVVVVFVWSIACFERWPRKCKLLRPGVELHPAKESQNGEYKTTICSPCLITTLIARGINLLGISNTNEEQNVSGICDLSKGCKFVHLIVPVHFVGFMIIIIIVVCSH